MFATIKKYAGRVERMMKRSLISVVCFTRTDERRRGGEEGEKQLGLIDSCPGAVEFNLAIHLRR